MLQLDKALERKLAMNRTFKMGNFIFILILLLETMKEENFIICQEFVQHYTPE